jgi:hypothetical protein
LLTGTGMVCGNSLLWPALECFGVGGSKARCVMAHGSTVRCVVAQWYGISIKAHRYGMG